MSATISQVLCLTMNNNVLLIVVLGGKNVLQKDVGHNLAGLYKYILSQWAHFPQSRALQKKFFQQSQSLWQYQGDTAMYTIPVRQTSHSFNIRAGVKLV